MTVMYYYTYSLTAIIEGIAKTINLILVKLTRDKDIFWRICKLIPYRPKIGHYAKFLDLKYSAILHAPYAHTFSKRDSVKMFSGLEVVNMTVYNISPVLRPMLYAVLGRKLTFKLARFLGWDLVVKAAKKAAVTEKIQGRAIQTDKTFA
ncbi:MAG: hypothetical protein U0T83_04175 [Bacteriovoracaceae bacterium]